MVDVIAATFGFVDWALPFIQIWGYLGLFVVEAIGSMSIFFPVPAFAINFILGGTAGFNPWMVGIVAGLGSAIGELTGYLLGRGGRELLNSKKQKIFRKAERWIEKHGIFIIIVVFAATPLPFDVVGILAGMLRYDVRRFFLATLTGKIISGLLLAWAGFYSINWILYAFNPDTPQNVTGYFLYR